MTLTFECIVLIDVIVCLNLLMQVLYLSVFCYMNTCAWFRFVILLIFILVLHFLHIIIFSYISWKKKYIYTAITEYLVTPVFFITLFFFNNHHLEKQLFSLFVKPFNIFQNNGKYPLPLPDEENRIPDALDPVTHETSTKHNIPDAVPTKFTDSNTQSNDVHIMGQKQEERPTSFFGQPGILAGMYISIALLKKNVEKIMWSYCQINVGTSPLSRWTLSIKK